MAIEPIRHWLANQENRDSLEASFVYRSWLDAAVRERLELVCEPIRHWLAHYQTHPEANYVYRSWLEAGGDLSFIEAGVIQWLA